MEKILWRALLAKKGPYKIGTRNKPNGGKADTEEQRFKYVLEVHLSCSEIIQTQIGTSWRSSRVVFFPKQGKQAYAEAKS